MKKGLLLFLLPLFMASAHAYGAEADADADAVSCLDRSVMIDTLIDQFDEQLAEVREVKGKGLIEIHVSNEGGTWTVLLTNPLGVSCIVASGDDFQPKATEGGVKI